MIRSSVFHVQLVLKKCVEVHLLIFFLSSGYILTVYDILILVIFSFVIVHMYVCPKITFSKFKEILRRRYYTYFHRNI